MRTRGRGKTQSEPESKAESVTLPEDLVEKIMAMVDFPFIFKARTLSKGWQARFSAILSLDNDDDKRLAVSFQKQVSEWSVNWKTFSAVYYSKLKNIAYDRKERHWRGMPSLSFLPQVPQFAPMTHLEGTLLLYWPRSQGPDSVLYVANILTQTWKQLPSRPHMVDGFLVFSTLVQGLSSDIYSVICLYREGRLDGSYFAQIYDSNSNAWSTKKFVGSRVSFSGQSKYVYLKGILFVIAMLNSGVNRPSYLVSFNFEEGTIDALELQFHNDEEKIFTDLVSCNDSLAVITYSESPRFRMTVWKVGPGGELLKVGQGPSASLTLSNVVGDPIFISRPISDGRAIFWRVASGRLLEYNLQWHSWNRLPFYLDHEQFEMKNFSFTPGLNPFIAV